MSNEVRTLHLFGGGALVSIAERIALKYNWNVVLRTGHRFVASLPKLDPKTKVLVGNDLIQLLQNGGEPKPNDIGLSISAPWIFKKKHIEKFHGNLYNIHNQPLPIFKGAGGSTWRILMKHYSGGSCIHVLTEGIDDGQIIEKVLFDFPETCTYPEDFDRITFAHASNLLEKWLSRIIGNEEYLDNQSIQYNPDEAEYWPRINSSIHGWINWEWPLIDIQSFCNAFYLPHQGAQTTLRGSNIFIQETSFILNKGKFHPFQTGIIYRIIDNILHVAHPDGTLLVKKYESSDEKLVIRLGDRFFTSREMLEYAMKTRIQYMPDGAIVKY